MKYDEQDDDVYETVRGVDGKPARILRDGAVARVRMPMRDHDTTRASVCDAFGNPPPRRPGFAYDADRVRGEREKQRAFSEYCRFLNDAYRAEDAEYYNPEQIGTSCTVSSERYAEDFGSEGVVRRVGSEILCVPTKPRSAAGATDAFVADGVTKDEALRDYERELTSAWKTPL